MKFSVGMGSPMTLDQVATEARVVEDSGFDYLTLVDTPASARDMHVMMAVAANATTRIGIGQGVADPMTMHPMYIANAAASIGELSGGRAFIGLSVGNPYYKFRTPATLAQLRDAVRFMKRFMAGESAEFAGVRCHSEWIGDPLPIYVAANGPKALQVAGEVADGAITLASHPVQLRWVRRQLEIGAERTGRDPDELDLWARCMVYVCDESSQARRETSAFPSTYSNLHQMLTRGHPEIAQLRSMLDAHEPGYSDRLIEDSKAFHSVFDVALAERLDVPHNDAVSDRLIDHYHLIGTPEEIRQRIEALRAERVSTVSMTTYTLADRTAMIREVGSRVIPLCRN